MAPKIHFIGTGTADLRGELNEGGFLLKTENANILVDPGPGAAQGLGNNKIDAILVTHPERGHDASLIKAEVVEEGEVNGTQILKKEAGYTFKLPDGNLTYITGLVNLRKTKEYNCDVLLLFEHKQEEKLIEKIKPRLAILTGYDAKYQRKNPVYVARDLKKKTGIQVVAARDGLTIDLYSYSALAEQKALTKFTKEK